VLSATPPRRSPDIAIWRRSFRDALTVKVDLKYNAKAKVPSCSISVTRKNWERLYSQLVKKEA